MKALSSSLACQVHASYHLSSIPQAIEELVFNSIDAGATMIQITVSPEQLYFEVKDNGSGIGYEDIKEIGNSYVTSKLISESDLNSLQTYGYHGQFLACLSLVSRIEIRSRHCQSSQSYFKVLENGTATLIQPCTPLNGTTISVHNFLKNYPVRTTSFSNQRDLACIKKKLERISLMHQDIVFVLKDLNGKVLEIPRRNSLVNTFKQMIGNEDCQVINTASMTGVICRKGSNSKIHQYLYINRRYVKNLKLFKLIADQFRKFWKENLEPSYILNIWLHPLTVDFTPSENHFEVDIKDWDEVASIVKRLITEEQEREEMAVENPASEYKAEEAAVTSSPSRKLILATKEVVDSKPEEVTQIITGWKQHTHIARPSVLPTSSVTVKSELKVDKRTLEQMDVIGQVDCKFIITKVDYLHFAIDQHAAHERVQLEKLQQQIYGENGQEVNIQTRAVDFSLSITAAQFSWLEQYKHLIGRYKWEFRLHRIDEEYLVTVTQVGVVLGVALEVEDMLEYAEQLESNGGFKITRPKAISKVLASKACRTAIMFGDRLSREQCMSLLNDLKQCKNPFACAHGRPTVAPLAQLPNPNNY